ncbi:B-cell receptor CD22 [Brachyhypopomus gauderio]|uniref:B-cell receptor CD22 n=1 Tax=Brachyhypopomus gauderio TaxID=698409 RepID=UPI0040432898
MYGVWSVLFLLVTPCVVISLTSEDSAVIQELTATMEEGSCVKINCTYIFSENMRMFWLKGAIWNKQQGRFDGKIVYSNTADYVQASEYSGRVEFLSGNRTANQGSDKRSCTLKINDLRKEDGGDYSFRIIRTDERFISRTNMSLTVKDNPCKVSIEPSGRVKEGDNVTLRCLTSEHCEHQPTWVKPVRNEMTYTTEGGKGISSLTFNASWMDDRRTFSCRLANNEDDCQSRNVTLEVEYAPRNTKVNGNPKYLKEGESATISCSSNANPNATFTWFKVNESQPIGNSQQITLSKAEQKISGIYYCQAQNKYGKEDSANITVNVRYAPKGVQVKIESADVKVGDTLTLKCLVNNSNPGVTPLSFKWYKDGKETGNNSDTIFIQNVLKDNKGSYHCQAKNDVGTTDSIKTQVSIKYPPQDTYISGTGSVKLYSSLQLSCLTDANPEPSSYSWFHTTTNGQNDAKCSQSQQVYRINKVTVQGAGWYMCRARNVIGMGSNSTKFRLHVLYPPKVPKLTMVSVIKESELLTISCTVVCDPVANITLRKAGPTAAVLMRVQGNTLRFSVNASVSAAGEYTCTAINTEGENSTSQQLKVLYAPKNVTTVIRSGQELEGNDLQLFCKAHSESTVSYTWDKSLGGQRQTVGEGQTLTLHSVKASDSGAYICIASNDLGSNQSTPLPIRVKYRPSVTIIHNMTSVWYQALPVHLTCRTQSDPPVTSYKWYRLEDNTIVLSTDQNYTAHPQSPGTYYCTAQNSIGPARSDPVQLFLNPHLKLYRVLIPVFILCIIIAGVFLYRFFLRKTASEQDDNPFFFVTETLSRSSTVANILSLSADGQSSATAHLPSSTSRDNLVISYTVYDVAKIPQTIQKGHPCTEDMTTTSTVNYDNLQFKDNTDPLKSTDSCGPIYSVVSKRMQNSKTVQSNNGDYENISGVATQMPAVTYMNWDSDTSEEEQVNYSTVVFPATPCPDPRRHSRRSSQDGSSSDEDVKIEYSQVK